MDSGQMEQKFDAIYMAILHRQLTAARRAYKISIQIAIDEKLDQIIDFLEKKEMSCSIRDIEEFRTNHLMKSSF